MYKIKSEVLVERGPSFENKEEVVISKFDFFLPSDEHGINVDEDGDLILCRKNKKSLSIEHSSMTELPLVGLQIWRGAFLLSDFIISERKLIQSKNVLELGSGVGLSSIVAGIYAKEVVCTDLNLSNILKLIEKNFNLNKELVKSKYFVKELDFLNLNWDEDLRSKIESSQIVMAADVIYDDKITEGFVKTLDKILNCGTKKTAYMTLEKRYVFTVQDLDSVAPMYEQFLRFVQTLNTKWKITYIPTNFDQYFEYDRTKELIMMKIEN